MIALSKPFTKEDVIQNKKSAICALNKQLEYYINDPSGNHLKKANLISYWLKDYVRMINYEERFNPTKNIVYKRGNIIKLNFGFNIGNEYGGLHYAIVLDNHNAQNSPVVTVIPLTSAKTGKEIHENSVFLGNDLYKLLKFKHDVAFKAILAEHEEINNTMKTVQSLISMAEKASNQANFFKNNNEAFDDFIFESEKNLDTAKELLTEMNIRHDKNVEQLDNLKKIEKEIAQMKKGSIAIVNQITTVSKMRIYDPKTSSGVLAGITLSQEQMNKINDKIKELYTI